MSDAKNELGKKVLAKPVAPQQAVEATDFKVLSPVCDVPEPLKGILNKVGDVIEDPAKREALHKGWSEACHNYPASSLATLLASMNKTLAELGSKATVDNAAEASCLLDYLKTWRESLDHVAKDELLDISTVAKMLE